MARRLTDKEKKEYNKMIRGSKQLTIFDLSEEGRDPSTEKKGDNDAIRRSSRKPV